jgi:hypothetical protein
MKSGSHADQGKRSADRSGEPARRRGNNHEQSSSKAVEDLSSYGCATVVGMI